MTIPLPSCPATIQSRALLHYLADQDPRVREAVLEKCRTDYEWFIDFWVDTFDSRRASGADLPFLLYDFQRDALRTIHEHVEAPADLLIEKSRDMGVSWLLVSYIVWRWLFTPNFTALFGSYKEEYVDNKTMDSLFGKIDYLIRRLPGWMLPFGFNPKRHRKHNQLIHPDPQNQAVILGDTMNPDFSRGGRHRVVIFDEAASWQYLEEGWMAASQTARCRIAATTPKGKNYFYELRNSGRYTVLTLHWRLHPLKDDAWYENECKRMSSEEVAQELDISYERSQSGVVYPEWHEVPKGHYPYQQGWPLWISVDFGLRDPTALIYWQRNPENGRYRMIACYQNQDRDIGFYVPFLTGEITNTDYGYTQSDLNFIAERATWGPAIIFGDPAGKQRSQVDGSSPIDVLLHEYGINVVTNDSARDFNTRKRFTDLGLRNLEVNMPACARVSDAMENARWQAKDRYTRSTSTAEKPIDDWTSHFRTAVEYFFVNVPPVHMTHRPPVHIRTSRWQQLHRQR